MTKGRSFNIEKFYPWVLAVGSVIGFVAALVLTLESEAVMKNPGHVPSCSISPILSCGPVMNSSQAHIFAFPNPFIGLFAFGVLLAVAVNMMAGATVKREARWYWRLYSLGHIFGLGFIVWLIGESIYQVRALCIYCMVTWAVVIAMNWYGWLWATETKRLMLAPWLRRVQVWGLKNHLGVLLMAYLLVFVLIVLQFSDYFRTLI